MIEICRDHAVNVKRWQDGQMVLRWMAAGMGEAAKQFRRVNGYLYLPALRVALDQTTLLSHPPRRMPPDHPWTAAEVPRRAGQPRPGDGLGLEGEEHRILRHRRPSNQRALDPASPVR